MIYICLQCGKKFTDIKSKKRKFCDKFCKAQFWKEDYKERFFGKNNPFYGRHHTKEANEKNKQTHLGPESEETKRKKREYWKTHTQTYRFEKGHNSWSKGKTKKDYPQLSNSGVKKGIISWNKDTKGIMKANSGSFKKGDERITGENNSSWKGGITTLVKKIRGSKKYIEWRTKIFQRDNFRCRKTGILGGSLVVHHVKNFADLIENYGIQTFKDALLCEQLWKIENGITFSKNVHIEFHKIYGRKNNDEKQVFEFIN